MKTLLAVDCYEIVIQRTRKLRNIEINFVRNETDSFFFVGISVLGM